MSSMSAPPLLPLLLSPLPGDDGPRKDMRPEGERSDFLKLLDFGEAPGGGDRLKCGDVWLGMIGNGETCFLTRIGLPGVDTANGMLGTGTDADGSCCD